MAQKISNLDIGYKVKITGSKYNGDSTGNPYEMIVAAKNHPGYPGGVVLITEYIAKRCAFDAEEPTNPDGNVKAYGSARYAHSNLLQWLNSSESTWYTAKHQYDQAPTADYVTQGQYDTEKGFMSHFPASFNSLLLDIPAVTVIAGTANAETVTTKWALPSIGELFGTSTVIGITEGSQFPYFTTDERRKCAYNTGSFPSSTFDYYTRSPWAYDDGDDTHESQLCGVMASGGIMRMVRPSNGSNFVRPFCVVSNDTLVSDMPTDGYYSIMYNAAPTAPTTISVPNTANGGTNINISWSASADADGNLAGYILDRRVDDGSWTQIYKGALLSYTDGITFGWTKVEYRVRAYDAYDAQSAFMVSMPIPITNNTAPTISGTDSFLGTFTSTFPAHSYTVNDAQGGTVTVVESLDGVVRRTYKASLGAANSFGFTAAEWQQILNGDHTITIKATDSLNMSTIRTWTFAKKMDTLSLTINPLPADAMPDRCVVAAVGSFPSGSTLKIEVCNNANDASPKWEDITEHLGKKYFFTNRTKTASAWAFGLRCTLSRGIGIGPGAVWLDYITINYR